MMELDFNSSQRAAEECHIWRKVAVDVSRGAAMTLVVRGHR